MLLNESTLDGVKHNDPSQPPTLLIVDGSDISRQAVIKLLEGEYRVIEADNGNKAFDLILDDSSIQLVLLELDLQGMNGFELLRNIRSLDDEGIRNLPVIVITDEGGETTGKQQALDIGATSFMAKPFTPSHLKASARAYTGYQRTTNALKEKNLHDALTGLLNRKGFGLQLEKTVSLAARHKQHLGVARINLNVDNRWFAQLGREGTDELINQISQILVDAIRKEDTLARDGIANFCLCLPATPRDGIKELLGRIHNELEKTAFTVGKHTIPVSASTGICSLEDGYRMTAGAIMSSAKHAMHVAIDEGEGKLVVDYFRNDEKPLGSNNSTSSEGSAKPKKAMANMDGDFPMGGRISVDVALSNIRLGQPEKAINNMDDLLDALGPLFDLLTDSQKVAIINGDFSKAKKTDI